MAELSPDERIKLAVQFIAQSPPGEVNDVVNDIRTIIGDDEALMPHVIPALRAYHLEQLHAVEHEADEAAGVQPHVSLLSAAVIAPTTGTEERFVDHEAGRSFAFDHLRMLPTDYEPYALPAREAGVRAALAESLAAYTRNHFADGRWSVACSQYPVATAAVGVLEPVPTPAGSATGTASVAPSRAASRAVSPIPEDAAEGAHARAALPKDAELDEPGALEDLDEEVEGVKARLDRADPTSAAALGETAGKVEPEPTPAVGNGQLPPDAEVDQEGGLEELDREVSDAELRAEAEDIQQEKAEAEQAGDDATAASLGERLAEVEATRAALEPPEASSHPVTPPVLAQTPIAQESIQDPTYTLEIVGNRYNPANFWTGRWRTRWVVDSASQTVSGSIHVDVHYYEQGNVQLATEHKASFPVPVETWEDGKSLASQVVSTIAKIEQAYQLELSDVYEEFGEKSFRNLRRALPVTRQKIDWDKVSGYTLGSDLSKAR